MLLLDIGDKFTASGSLFSVLKHMYMISIGLVCVILEYDFYFQNYGN